MCESLNLKEDNKSLFLVSENKLFKKNVGLKGIQESYYYLEFLKNIFNNIFLSKGSVYSFSKKAHYRNDFVNFLYVIVRKEISNAKLNGVVDINKIYIFFPVHEKYIDYSNQDFNYKNWTFNWTLIHELFVVSMQFALGERDSELDYYNCTKQFLNM